MRGRANLKYEQALRSVVIREETKMWKRSRCVKAPTKLRLPPPPQDQGPQRPRMSDEWREQTSRFAQIHHDPTVAWTKEPACKWRRHSFRCMSDLGQRWPFGSLGQKDQVGLSNHAGEC